MPALISHSPAETETLGEKLGRAAARGLVVALSGELGAGKTQFVRGLVRGLGGDSRAVSSPTFMLLNIYEGGRLTVYHLDAYRTSGAEDFESIGFAELLEQGGVVVVEWASRVRAILPPKCIEVEMEVVNARDREIVIGECK